MMRSDEYLNMAESELNHWWYSSLHSKVLKWIPEIPQGKTIKLADAACGTGGLLLKISEQSGIQAVGFDKSELALRFCRLKPVSIFKGSLERISYYFEPESLDVIVCNDALYFLTDRERSAFLLDCFNLLKSSGRIILNVPSGKVFRGSHDNVAGIRSRFAGGFQLDPVSATFFVMEYSTFWPFFLSPVILSVRLLSRIRMVLFPQSLAASDLQTGGPWINRICSFIQRSEDRLSLRLPFGSSHFVVLTKINPIL